tara:strand:- start:6197 stop:7153 length:957 start_codon:yes stop_codon:yes gene_type:complete
MQFFQIIGTQRSGSNLLRLILNEFSEIYAPHPPHLLSNFYPIKDKYQNGDMLINDMIDWVKKNPVKWDIVPSKKSIENLINEKNVFQIFKAIYSYSNPKFWCCKSLDNFNFYNNNSFKNLDPIYIYIYRDGRDVASSFKKASIGEKHIYHIAKKWNRDQRKCLELKYSIDKYNFFSIRYEDLLEDPRLIIKNFCKKYGIIYNEKFLDFYKSKESKKTSDSGGQWKNLSKPLIKNNMNKYKKELTKEEILIFESINKTELLKLGYKLENHESKIDFTYSEEEVRTFDLINSKLKIKANNNQSSFEKNLIQKQKNILKFN